MASNTYSEQPIYSQWAGIDDQSSSSPDLMQAGCDTNYDDSTDCWVEDYPQYPSTIQRFNVNPNDWVNTQIWYDGNNQCTVEVSDETTHTTTDPFGWSCPYWQNKTAVYSFELLSNYGPSCNTGVHSPQFNEYAVWNNYLGVWSNNYSSLTQDNYTDYISRYNNGSGGMITPTNVVDSNASFNEEWLSVGPGDWPNDSNC